MGTFRIDVQGVGGHGCQRDVKDGGKVEPHCGSPACPDCLTREFVTRLVATGVTFSPSSNPDLDGHAKLIHWPGQDCAVEDDLLTLQRKGSF